MAQPQITTLRMSDLHPHVLAMLNTVYKNDNGRLHEDVSDAVDLIVQYSSGDISEVDLLRVNDELHDVITKLHRAMGIEFNPPYLGCCHSYALGFILKHFMPRWK